ncbi:hypothetical protein C2845_PM04G15120 [Panicum miliaceum]|uniref:Uncharacterized protein n=1 Tax=Panicum miliaceum TaxID=4540 RepID=A0A3L6QUY5_PANMI|nr:hypothetical protein C2845_PM04G15120 [Panicum miliaceum]
MYSRGVQGPLPFDLRTGSVSLMGCYCLPFLQLNQLRLTGAEQGYNSSDTKAVNQIIIFLRKSSTFVPGNDVGSEPALNLKGYLVGNPYTNLNIDRPSIIPFAHRMGLISDQIYEAYKKSCSVGDSSHRSLQCTSSLDGIHEIIGDHGMSTGKLRVEITSEAILTLPHE